MRLYLVRHGDAAEKSVDRERNLTPAGARQAQALAEWCKVRAIHVSAVWHSGRPRAIQTAEPIARAIDSGAGLIARDGLGPLDKTKYAASEIRELEADLMIVGHEPWLTKLATRLLGGKASHPALVLDKGGIACLEWGSQSHWIVEWLLPADVVAGILGPLCTAPHVAADEPTPPSTSQPPEAATET